MTLATLLADLRGDPRFMETVAAWRTLPAQPPRLTPIPTTLHPELVLALNARGITQLYTHQAQAVDAALAGRNVAVVTPTASGKTLCYNLPVFHALLEDPGSRAIYLFPTKALAQDQLAELRRLAGAAGEPDVQRRPGRWIATYDGDTPTSERSAIRKQARLLLTNPDMLHTGILPYHTQWAAFLAGLRFVVVDEMHTYRGVFGSQVANVIRRLQRLCAHYGSAPQFICTSATIANPQELAERLTEAPFALVDDNGAPRGEKHILLVNPPLLDPEKGIRRSATLEASDLAARILAAGVQTIVFGRSRLTTELLLSYVRDKLIRTQARAAAQEWTPIAGTTAAGETWRWTQASVQGQIRGYRGGYLPAERRAIESGLRTGEVQGVVATNALELGIDIGQLQAAVLCGYPGSIASAWQQMGRAGRTREAALAILVTTAGALDQYLAQHVEYLFERSPEHALINPDNLMLLVDQIRCAAFELPFSVDDNFGASAYTGDVLTLLQEEGDLHAHGASLFWSGAGYPARSVSLRSSGADSVSIQVMANAGEPNIIGQVDRSSAPSLVHDGAVYLHEGQSYLVQRLNLDQLLAEVNPVNVDYYTETMVDTQVTVLAQHGEHSTPRESAAFGDVAVTSQVAGYRRVKRHTHETLGVQPLEFPPQTVETAAYWLAISAETQRALEEAGLWYDSVNDYGPNWDAVRAAVRQRDGFRCTQCRRPEPPGQEHDVHHKTPFRTFGYVRGVNENYLRANRLENLVLVCRSCHQRIETAGRLVTGLDGLAYVLSNLAPLYLMCDRSDLGMHVDKSQRLAGSAGGKLATLYLYERVPAGLGFSAQLFELHMTLLAAAQELVTRCRCQQGCPACVGPVLEGEPAQLPAKQLTLGLLARLVAG